MPAGCWPRRADGRTEQVLGLCALLRGLGLVQSSCAAPYYPAVLLCLMAVILAVLLVQVPVFSWQAMPPLAGGTQVAAGYRHSAGGYVVGARALVSHGGHVAVLAVTLLQARTPGAVAGGRGGEDPRAARCRPQAGAGAACLLDLPLPAAPAEDSLRAAVISRPAGS